MEKIKELYTYHVAMSFINDNGKLSTAMLIIDLDFMIKTGDDVMDLKELIDKDIKNDVVILGWNLLEG